MLSPGQEAVKYFHPSKGQLGMAFMNGPPELHFRVVHFPPEDEDKRDFKVPLYNNFHSFILPSRLQWRSFALLITYY